MNVIKNNKLNGKTEEKPSMLKSIYRFFISMRFSLFLLALIAAGSIIGTFIKQGGTEEEYLHIYTESTYRIIKFFGLHDTYHSTWFYVLIALFALNLALCTTRQLARIIREKHKTDLPGPDRLQAMECYATLPLEIKEKKIKRIQKTYHLVHKDKDGLSFEKGALSRWGAFITHGSILVVLIGGLIGLMFGFRGFVILSAGETKNHMITEDGNQKEKMLDFAIKCKDFKASFYPNGAPKDYVSTVEIIEGGKTLQEKNIRVNSPLYYKGLRIYQSGYGQKNSFKFNIDGEDLVLVERQSLKKRNLILMVSRFEKEIHNFGPGVQIVYLEGDEPKTTWFLQKIDKLRSQTIQGANIRLVDIQEDPYTSLEVTYDPGVFVVWAGFALILFGLYVTFFTYHRRIFIINTEKGAIMSGYAVKNKEAFRIEFEKLKEEIYGNER